MTLAGIERGQQVCFPEMLFVLQTQGLLQFCTGQRFLQSQHNAPNFGGHRLGQPMAGQTDHKRKSVLVRFKQRRGRAIRGEGKLLGRGIGKISAP